MLWNKESFDKACQRNSFDFVIPPGNAGYVYYNLGSWKLYLDGIFQLEDDSAFPNSIVDWLNKNEAYEI